MNIEEVIRKDDVLIDIEANSVKRVFCDLSEHLSVEHEIPQRALYDALNERERLGSTAVGEGVLIPHARLDGISQVHGVFARLAEPIDVDALDDKRADLVVMLVAPKEDQSAHMKALSRITRVLRDGQNRDVLREAESRDTMYEILTA